MVSGFGFMGFLCAKVYGSVSGVTFLAAVIKQLLKVAGRMKFCSESQLEGAV